MSLVQNPYSGKKIFNLSFRSFAFWFFGSCILIVMYWIFHQASDTTMQLQNICVNSFFIALPCDLHWLSTHSTAALYISSRRRWTPSGCWWKCKDCTVCLKDCFPHLIVKSLSSCKIWIGCIKDVFVKIKYKWVMVVSELLLDFWSLAQELILLSNVMQSAE